MCRWHTTALVKINGRLRDIDSCIAPIVRALNEAGVPTVASCCGHGHAFGTIALADGRELVIAPDYACARLLEALPGVDIHGKPLGAGRGNFLRLFWQIWRYRLARSAA